MTLLMWLSSKINKAVVAVLGAALSWLAAKGMPVDWLLDPGDVQLLGGFITAWLVWRIPNDVKEKLTGPPSDDQQ